MSTPKNHHYVSRVLSNNFLSARGRIYRYSKVSQRISELNSTKGLFSQLHLNTVIDEEGNQDSISIEQAIGIHFEKDFPKHYKVVMDVLAKNHQIGIPIPNGEEVNDAVKAIIEMGFIGRIRHPLDMFNSNSAIFKAVMNLADGMGGELRNGLLDHIIKKSKMVNKLPLDLQELSRGMAELMGETTYSIMVAPENHYFLLPDCTAVTKRFKMKDDIIDGQVFINPAMVVGLVIMPISSKVLLAATMTEFAPHQGNGIYILSEETMLNYNRSFFDSAIFELACENKDYLKSLVTSTDVQAKKQESAADF